MTPNTLTPWAEQTPGRMGLFSSRALTVREIVRRLNVRACGSPRRSLGRRCDRRERLGPTSRLRGRSFARRLRVRSRSLANADAGTAADRRRAESEPAAVVLGRTSAPETVVRMIVGAEDDVAIPEDSRRYAEALQQRGVDVQLTIEPGLGHNILVTPAAFRELGSLVRQIAASGH